MRTYGRAGTRTLLELLLSSCHLSSALGGFALYCHHLQTLLNLPGITLHDDIAARVCRALIFIALRLERLAQTAGIDMLYHTAADNLHGSAHGHVLARLKLIGPSEEHVHQLLLYLRRLILAIVLREARDLLF